MVNKTITYNIGGIGIQVNFLCPFLVPDNLGGSHFFKGVAYTWALNIRSTNNIDLKDYKIVFAGSEEFDIEMPYKWSVYSNESKKAIVFEFEQDEQLSMGMAEIDTETNTIELHLKLNQQKIQSIDPFFHPFGILLLQFLVHLNNGAIIHASAIEYKKKGYLFSAISGTGKSTMANLWKERGAKIINDDRIIISPNKSEYCLFNTPMPYYQDKNKSIPLFKAFLLKQSKENYIRPLSTLKGTMGLFGNCIQYQYDKHQVQQRLHVLENIAKLYGVYELGFKPDTSITSFIEAYFGE